MPKTGISFLLYSEENYFYFYFYFIDTFLLLAKEECIYGIKGNLRRKWYIVRRTVTPLGHRA